MHDRLAGFGGPELVNTGNQQPNKEVDWHKVFYVFCHDLTEYTVLARDIITSVSRLHVRLLMLKCHGIPLNTV